MTLEEANKYMEKKLGMPLYKFDKGFAHKNYIVIVGLLSEDHAEIEYEIVDGEYYATKTCSYIRNQLYDINTEHYHIPRCWISN